MSHLKKRYNLTEEDVEALTSAQNELCAICHQKKPLCVDHVHTTGEVRGLLCRACNFGIGYFHDDPKKLQAAIIYLEKHLGKS